MVPGPCPVDRRASAFVLAALTSLLLSMVFRDPWTPPALLAAALIPPCALGVLVRTGRDAGHRSRRALARGMSVWCVLLAAVEVQAFHGGVTAAAWLDFARSPTLAGAMTAWWSGVSDLFAAPHVKLLVLAALAPWNLAWACLTIGLRWGGRTFRGLAAAALHGWP